jgi:hypothetical protein
VVNEAVGVAWLQRDSGPGDSSLSLGLGASVGHGDERRLRSEVETSWARNRLRRAGEPIEGLPDLGVGLAGVGTENDLRGRLTLRRRFGSSISVYGYGEASRRELSGLADPAVREGTAAPALGPATVDVLTGTMQVTTRRLTASGNLGTSRVETTPSQEVWFWAASLTMRPVRRLALDGSYRVDHRDFVLAPGIDARRVEGTAQLDLGAFLLKAQAFETTETPAGRPERRNRGVSLSLVRRFGGWLPIVTGAPSGGTIQ